MPRYRRHRAIDLHELIDRHLRRERIPWPPPRQAVITLVGEENQSLPRLVLAIGATSPHQTGGHQGCAFSPTRTQCSPRSPSATAFPIRIRESVCENACPLWCPGRAQRSLRCCAEPGPMQRHTSNMGPGSAAHRRREAALYPEHESAGDAPSRDNRTRGLQTSTDVNAYSSELTYASFGRPHWRERAGSPCVVTRHSTGVMT